MKPFEHTLAFLHVRPIMLLMGSVAIWAPPVFALDGQIQIHDPSTIALCDGKFYTYGTGGTTLVSDDGWTWRRGVTPAPRNGPRHHSPRRPLLPVYCRAISGRSPKPPST